MLANLSPASSASLKLGARAEITITQATLAVRQNRVVLTAPEVSVRPAPKCLIYRA